MAVERAGGPGAVGSDRVESFSDAVFAIAITLLVLDIRQPVGSGALWEAMLAQWPSFLAYALSFLLIGVVWVNHHTVFQLIDRVDVGLLWLNLLLLLDVAFMPYPTVLLADALISHRGQSTAAVCYGATLVVGGLLFNAVWFHAARRQSAAARRYSARARALDGTAVCARAGAVRPHYARRTGPGGCVPVGVCAPAVLLRCHRPAGKQGRLECARPGPVRRVEKASNPTPNPGRTHPSGLSGPRIDRVTSESPAANGRIGFTLAAKAVWAGVRVCGRRGLRCSVRPGWGCAGPGRPATIRRRAPGRAGWCRSAG